MYLHVNLSNFIPAKLSHYTVYIRIATAYSCKITVYLYALPTYDIPAACSYSSWAFPATMAYSFAGMHDMIVDVLLCTYVCTVYTMYMCMYFNVCSRILRSWKTYVYICL